MKTVIILLLISSSKVLPRSFPTDEIKEDADIDDLVKQYLEYIRLLLQKHEPFSFPTLPRQRIVNKDIDLNFSTSNVQVSKTSSFTIDKISNDVKTQKSLFAVTIPQARLEGKYQVTGTGFNKRVQGSGSFSANINHFVQTGEIQFTVVERSLQIKDMELNYELNSAQFDVQGLQIEGVSKEQIENFLNENLLTYLEQNKSFICRDVSSRLQIVTNQILYGHSLSDLLSWLQKVVRTTPDPPPFPFQNL